MPELAQKARVMRFGVFEIDLQAGELRKSGTRIKLQEQPFQILALLLEHPGQVITREELRQRLWPADTFVDFDHSLNSAVKKLRQALGDDSDNPRFIETLPRRGYRLIAPMASGATFSDQPAEAVSSVPKPRAKASRHRLLALFAAVALTVGALVVWKTVFRIPAAPRVLRVTALTNDGVTKEGLSSMATDGSRIYFTETLPGPRSIIVQVSVNGGEPGQLSVPLKYPAVLDLSKDGTELLISNYEGLDGCSLWILPVAGGSPRRVGSVVACDARFGPDGTSIIYGNEHDVYSVNRDGSSPRKLLAIDTVPFSFRFSPDGRAFRFSQFDQQIDNMTIMEARADGTGLHNMFQGCCGDWTADGRFFIFQAMALPERRIDAWALPEEKRFFWHRRENKPVQLTSGPVGFQNLLPSKDGKKIFALGESHRAEVVRYDSRSGQFVPYLSGISAEGLAFSRDEQWVAYTSFPDGTLWRSKVDGSERRQLTFLPLRVLLPRWSPDGKQIAFQANIAGAETSQIYVVSSEGGTPLRIFPSEQSQTDPNWSPDGNSLVFGTFAVPNMPIYTIDLRSKRLSILPGSRGIFSPRWSPDGKYIAAIATEHPAKLMLFDFATQKWTEEFGFEIGYLSWSHDGKYIYFQDKHSSAQDIRNRIVRLRLSDRKIEDIVDVKSVGRMTTGTFVDWFDLATDDSPLFARDISSTEIYALELDWP